MSAMQAMPNRCQAFDGSWSRLFVLTSGIILVLTGAVKVISTFGTANALAVADPLFHISFRLLLVSVGLMELSIGFFCLLTKMQSVSIWLIAWMAINFLLYRISLWGIGWRGFCHCLGTLTEAVHISPALADNALKLILVYLLFGSCMAIWVDMRASRRKFGLQ